MGLLDEITHLFNNTVTFAIGGLILVIVAIAGNAIFDSLQQSNQAQSNVVVNETINSGRGGFNTAVSADDPSDVIEIFLILVGLVVAAVGGYNYFHRK